MRGAVGIITMIIIIMMIPIAITRTKPIIMI